MAIIQSRPSQQQDITERSSIALEARSNNITTGPSLNSFAGYSHYLNRQIFRLKVGVSPENDNKGMMRHTSGDLLTEKKM